MLKVTINGVRGSYSRYVGVPEVARYADITVASHNAVSWKFQLAQPRLWHVSVASGCHNAGLSEAEMRSRGGTPATLPTALRSDGIVRIASKMSS